MSAALDMQSRLQQVTAPPRSAELLRSAVHPLADQDGKNPVEMAPATEPVQRRAFSQVPVRTADTCSLTPRRCPFGGACHSCPLRVQAKLTVSQPGDKYEEEADRVADQVMSMPDPQVQRACPTCDEEETAQTKPVADQITPLVQRQIAPEEEEQEEPVQTKALVQRQAASEEDKEEPVQTKLLVQRQAVPEQEDEEEESVQTKPLVQRQAEEEQEEEEPVQTKPLVQRQIEEEQEEEEPVQTKAVARQPTSVSPTLSTQIQSLHGGGQPLPAATRAFFEPHFGYDFSGVRIHTDVRAAETARALRARAFTVGRDVVFGAGEYMPGALEGRRLLGHELTHVVQQSRSPQHTNLAQRKVFLELTRLQSPLTPLTWIGRAKHCALVVQTHDLTGGCVLKTLELGPSANIPPQRGERRKTGSSGTGKDIGPVESDGAVNRGVREDLYVVEEKDDRVKESTYLKKGHDVRIDKYRFLSNNCCHWARRVIEAAGGKWPISKSINVGRNPGDPSAGNRRMNAADLPVCIRYPSWAVP